MSEKDKQKTKVIFRQWEDGSVIALFPELPADRNGDLCDSYEHVGQHGAANPDIIRRTKPTNSKEKIELGQELERLGYNLDERKRLTNAMNLKRRAEAKAR